LLEFRAQEGRNPDIDHVDSDVSKLKEIAVEVLKSLGIREDFLDLDFTAYVALFTSHVKYIRTHSSTHYVCATEQCFNLCKMCEIKTKNSSE